MAPAKTHEAVCDFDRPLFTQQADLGQEGFICSWALATSLSVLGNA